MTALSFAVVLLACIVVLLGGAYIHLAAEVRILRDADGARTDALAALLGLQVAEFERELARHDDILVEHDGQLESLDSDVVELVRRAGGPWA